MVWDSAIGIDNDPHNREHGIAYIGNYRTLILNRGGWEVIEEKQSKNKVSKPFAPSIDNGPFFQSRKNKVPGRYRLGPLLEPPNYPGA